MEDNPRISRHVVSNNLVKDGNPNRVKDPAMALRGSYALVIELHQPGSLTIGRLGRHPFPLGFYIYTGSALGSGGIQARVQRHLRYTKAKTAHWHIDGVLDVGKIIEVWWKPGTRPMECSWAARLATIGSIHIPGFGASDCRCPGHLVHFGDQNEIAVGFRLLEGDDQSQEMGRSPAIQPDLKK